MLRYRSASARRRKIRVHRNGVARQSWYLYYELRRTLASALRGKYGLKAEEVIWIEHYPEAKDRRKEDFDLVRFAGAEGDCFRNPVWTRITEQAVDELIACVRNVEELLPRRTNQRPARHSGLAR